MTPTARAILQVVVACLILFLGKSYRDRLIATAPAVKKAPPRRALAQVEVRAVDREDRPVRIRAHGVAEAAREVTLRPRVTGAVTWVAPDLAPGQLITRGTELVRVDRSDYQLALARAQAALEQARRNLELEEGRHRIASKEYSLFADEVRPPAEGSALARRLPQLAAAKAAVTSAETAVEDAKLDLNRTKVFAPFNAFVRTKRTAEGQLVTPQTDLVTLVGTDRYWVRLALSPAQLALLRIPGVDGDVGSEGEARVELGGRVATRPARVVRLIAEVDPAVRLPSVLVEVRDPFGLEEAAAQRGSPILLGAYLDLTLEGETLAQVIPLPRTALLARRRVWVLDEANRVQSRTVRVAWEEGDTAWIDQGLEPGERVVVSQLSGAVDGLEVQPREVTE